MADVVIFRPEESYPECAGPSKAGQQVGAPGEEKWTLKGPKVQISNTGRRGRYCPKQLNIWSGCD